MISPFIERVASGDKVLVNRLGVSYQVDVDNLFDNPTDNDILLVNYQGQSYKLKVNDVTSTDKDSALILINREVNGEWKSFRTTLGELKGVAVQDVTFNVEIRTPQKTWNYNANTKPGCPNPVSGAVNGGKITATVTAKSNQTYLFQNGTLYIDGEWILCCGSTGDTGYQIEWAYRQIEGDYEVCYSNGNNETVQQSKGLSAVGVGNIGPGQAQQNWGNGPQPNSNGTYGVAGAGGFGCPAGNRTGTNNKNPGEGGYSQSRPRAEDSGDTWNGITVTNISHSNGRWDGYNAISANGITLTNNSGVIGDLIPTPTEIVTDEIETVFQVSTPIEFLFYNNGVEFPEFSAAKTQPLGSTITVDLTGKTYGGNPGAVAGPAGLAVKTANGANISNIEYVLGTTDRAPGRYIWASHDGITWTYIYDLQTQGSQGVGTHIVNGTYAYIVFNEGVNEQTTTVNTQFITTSALVFKSNKDLARLNVNDKLRQDNASETPIGPSLDLQQYLDITDSDLTSGTLDNGFDGNPTTTFETDTRKINYTPPTSFTNVSNITIGINCSDSNLATSTLYGPGNTFIVQIANHEGGPLAFALDGSTTVETIQVERANGGTGFSYIDVDGIRLVNNVSDQPYGYVAESDPDNRTVTFGVQVTGRPWEVGRTCIGPSKI